MKFEIYLSTVSYLQHTIWQWFMYFNGSYSFIYDFVLFPKVLKFNKKDWKDRKGFLWKSFLLYIPNVYKYINIASDVALDCFDWSLPLWSLGTTTISQHSGWSLLKWSHTWVVAFHSPTTPNPLSLLCIDMYG